MSDFEDSNNDDSAAGAATTTNQYRDGLEDDDTPTVELQPVPISKNAGNRFVAFVWDRELRLAAPQQHHHHPDTTTTDPLDWHYDRIQRTEEHVMFCRKQNLYNETFNTESMVDILWSLPMYV